MTTVIEKFDTQGKSLGQETLELQEIDAITETLKAPEVHSVIVISSELPKSVAGHQTL